MVADINIVGVHISPNEISDSDGRVCTGNWVDYLIAGNFDDSRVFYHLDASVAALLRHLEVPEDKLKELYKSQKCSIGSTKFTYYNNSFFAIDRDGQSARFYDMSQYRESHGLVPNGGLAYCKEKAIEARDTAYAVMQVLTDIGLKVEDFGTPVKIFVKNLLSDKPFPTVPHEVAKMCITCIEDGGTWIETFKRGYFPEAWHLDLRSSYGSSMINLVDTRRGTWHRSKDYIQSALYGYMNCTVNMTARFHPILYRASNICLTPVGKWNRGLNKKQVDFIRQYELGSVEIHDGYWYVPKGEQYEFLKGAVTWLFNKRMDLQGLPKKVVGRIIQSLYGMTLHRTRTGFGELFNPQIAVECEVDSALKMAKLCLDNNIIPIATHTDSILTDIELPVVDTKTIGCWRCDAHGRAISLGMNKAVCVEGLNHHAETSINFDWLYKNLSDNPEATEFIMKAPMPWSLGNCVNYNQLNKLGTIEDKQNVLNLKAYCVKRIYSDRPTTASGILSGNQTGGAIPVRAISLIRAIDENEA